MSLLVVGSIAIDEVTTPCGSTGETLGGAATYFSHAASFLAPNIRVVGVIGEDFPDEYYKILNLRENVCLKGVQKMNGKNTFRWKGKYEGDMNEAQTLDVQLNVLAEFDPKLPAEYKDSRLVFLANDSPVNQQKVLDQIENPQLTFADTMNFWIENQPNDLRDMLSRIDGIILNDMEAKMLTSSDNLISAGKKIQQMGPRYVVIKKGEHGSILLNEAEVHSLPAFPTEALVDPTGAGDSFAGGFMGYIASHDNFNATTLKKAIAYGTVTASINVEGFSLDRFKQSTRKHIDERYELYKSMLDLN